MFQRVLLPLDGSVLAERVIPHAAAVARTFHAELVLIRVLDVGVHECALSVDGVEWAMRRAEATAYLEDVADALRDQGIAVQAEVIDGRAAEAILQHAFESEADLIVLTTHGKGGVNEFRLCGTAHKIASLLPLSALLLPVRGDPASQGSAEYRRIAVPIDCSMRAEAAVRIAARMALETAASLLLLHVIPVPELPSSGPLCSLDVELRDRVVARNRRVGEAYLRELRTRYRAMGLAVETRITVGRDVVAGLAALLREEQVDLVLLAAHGGDGGGAPLGAVAQGLIGCVERPMLVFQDEPGRARSARAREIPRACRVPSRAAADGA